MKRKLIFLSLLGMLAAGSFSCKSHSNCNCPGLGHAQAGDRDHSIGRL